jgi:hypothetical protein
MIGCSGVQALRANFITRSIVDPLIFTTSGTISMLVARVLSGTSQSRMNGLMTATMTVATG